MKVKKIAGIFLSFLLLCSSVGAAAYGESGSDVPETHTIAYDAALDTLDDEDGADAFNHSLDHADSKYYVFRDYYNMQSEGSLHILSGFQTYQQTTEYSCGCASALMVLYYFGNHDYNEMELCGYFGTVPGKGTTVEGIADFFTSLGWNTDSHADTSYRFDSIEESEAWLLGCLDNGIPVMVSWEDWAGHWQVVIGLDTCGTDDPYDDVLIVADPYDITDHYQDGYYTIPFGRFFDMWREGPCIGKSEPYVQPFVAAFPQA